ncbi:hypothetical protein BDP27DRAFT_1373341 [Rhodocollybia butyracea]|uniref:Uncharacterized protein n=1 Tax=Rhodocollybia butyracea TaxID=206335 RepID=A0A9P5P6X8_9AGAR|nr:hypothetical protein BDP27DRAFT_1373341 [Rhodocollybia butyracea]
MVKRHSKFTSPRRPLTHSASSAWSLLTQDEQIQLHRPKTIEKLDHEFHQLLANGDIPTFNREKACWERWDHPYQDEAECRMAVFTSKYRGKIKHFFKAPHKGCKYKVPIDEEEEAGYTFEFDSLNSWIREDDDMGEVELLQDIEASALLSYRFHVESTKSESEEESDFAHQVSCLRWRAPESNALPDLPVGLSGLVSCSGAGFTPDQSQKYYEDGLFQG